MNHDDVTDKPMPCCTSGFCHTDPDHDCTGRVGTVTWTTISTPESACDPLDGTTEKFDACCSALMQIRDYVNEIPFDDTTDHDQEALELAWAMEKQLLAAIQRYCTALTE
jgi:hypothetical protein